MEGVNTAMQDPRFFISQSGKVAALLSVVVMESSSTTDPQALIDYLELTDIITQLLDEAQFYSVLSSQQLRARERDVRGFMRKIQTVEDVIADWKVRTTVSAKPLSKKRTRSLGVREEIMGSSKRRTGDGVERSMVEDAEADLLSAIVPRSIETPATEEPYWWTTPFCE